MRLAGELRFCYPPLDYTVHVGFVFGFIILAFCAGRHCFLFFLIVYSLIACDLPMYLDHGDLHFSGSWHTYTHRLDFINRYLRNYT